MPYYEGVYYTINDYIAEIEAGTISPSTTKKTGFVRTKPQTEEEDMPPRKAMEGFKFGADPELFIFDSNDKPVPAEGIIPGTKNDPYPVDCGAWQVDGMAAEFNIEPASDFKTWSDNFDTVLDIGKKMLPPGYTMRAVPFARFDPDAFERCSDGAKELGCSPDFNAWTGEVNPPPAKSPEDRYLAVAAGHIHYGWTKDETPDNLQHIMNCQDLVKQLDWYLGAWAVKHDPDPTRRRLYGRAGACRYKSYGVEYRVLSNFWVLEKSKRLLVWNRMIQAIDDMKRLHVPERAGGYNDSLIQSINDNSMLPIIKDLRFPVLSVDHSYNRF